MDVKFFWKSHVKNNFEKQNSTIFLETLSARLVPDPISSLAGMQGPLETTFRPN